ncbi:kinase-like protein, partial [Rickenella mellea]
LLDHDTGSTGSNRSLVRMITWLAKKCGTCPDCLNLAQVQPIGSRAITGGGFADIWKGVFMDRSVALKALRVFLNDSSKKKEMVYRDFAHEAVVWRQLKHRNILPFYGIFKGHDTFDHLCLVSPWMNAGTVLNFLKHSPDSDRIALVGDVVDGLRYLHEFEPTVVHGDLKGSNVFVTPSQTACLADFGLSRFRDPQYSSGESTTESLKGTIRWQARELLIPGGDGKIARPSRESDIYAFGCVCLEIMTGDVPFSELTDVAVTFAILQNKTPQRPAGNCIKYGLDDSLWNSIEACWITEPSQRPTSVQLGQYFDQRRGTIPNDHYDSSHVTRQTLEKYGFPENYLSQIAQV